MKGVREEISDALDVPASMTPLVQGREWARNTVGESGGSVFRLHGHVSESDLYLKHGCGSVACNVTDEMVRLRWFANHIPVPAVRFFMSSTDEAWLLMTALPGRTAYQVLEANPADHIRIVDAITRFLLRCHAIPADDCPFNSDHRLRLGLARQRLAGGLVDTEDFGEEHEGWTAQQVWDEMTALLPFVSDPVVTHGDFSLDNILLDGGEVVGCIDVDRAGIADRYQDLAILWDCLGEFGPELQRRLFMTYGIASPDMQKLRFHLGLDEFF